MVDTAVLRSRVVQGVLVARVAKVEEVAALVVALATAKMAVQVGALVLLPPAILRPLVAMVVLRDLAPSAQV